MYLGAFANYLQVLSQKEQDEVVGSFEASIARRFTRPLNNDDRNLLTWGTNRAVDVRLRQGEFGVARKCCQICLAAYGLFPQINRNRLDELPLSLLVCVCNYIELETKTNESKKALAFAQDFVDLSIDSGKTKVQNSVVAEAVAASFKRGGRDDLAKAISSRAKARLVYPKRGQ